MSAVEFRAAWRSLSRAERRFVRVVAALGETAGTDAGNELVAAYAARRLARTQVAVQALVAVGWVVYAAATLTLLRGVPTAVLGAIAVGWAAAQATWLLRVEGRLRHVIAVNRA